MSKLGKLLGEFASKFANTSNTMLVELESGRTEVPKVVATSAGTAIIPFVRQELAKAYQRSGLGRVSGDLYKASVEQSRIIVKPNAIIIVFPAGKSKRLYKRAGAWEHGAVRGPDGAKLSKRLRKNLMTIPGAVTMVDAKPFFRLQPDQIKRVRDRYWQLVDQKMKGAIRG